MRLDTGKQATSDLSAYLIRTGGVADTLVEALLVNGGSQPLSADEWSLLQSNFAGYSRLAAIFLASEAQERRDLTVGGIPVTIVSPCELFAKLVRLPSDMDGRLFHNRLESVDDRYFQLNQGRTCRILNDPRNPGRQGALVEDVATYLTEWSDSERSRFPILLLGERGTGKSWQILDFCLKQLELNRVDPWRFGPAFYVGLRDLMSEIRSGAGGFLPLLRHLTKRYGSLEYIHDFALLSAFLEVGHTIICFDGFDEIEHRPGDISVARHMANVLAMLSISTRFILTSRTSHFNSIRDLLRMEVWNGLQVGDTFEVLALNPLEMEKVRLFCSDVREKLGLEEISRQLALHIEQGLEDDELAKAFRICATHPGILSGLLSRLQDKRKTPPFELLSSTIEDTLVIFNIRKGRTTDRHLDESGNIHDLSVAVRLTIVEEIAWYMAERQLSTLRSGAMPPRIMHWFRLEGDALERDIRSQLEVVS